MDRLYRAISIVLFAGLALAGGCEAGRPAHYRAAEGPSVCSQAGQVAFVSGYLRGYEQARQEGKPMLVLFSVPGCGYCEQMVREASADEQVVRLSRRFVCILVDADQEPEICREFRVRAYPTIQFMSPRGVPLNRLMGRTPARRLAVQMQAALEATASRMRFVGESAVR
jgi:thiol-disulfide isomerase/thioredoxin